MWHIIRGDKYIKEVDVSYAEGYYHAVHADFTVVGVGELRHKDGRLAYFTMPPTLKERDKIMQQIIKIHEGSIWIHM